MLIQDPLNRENAGSSGAGQSLGHAKPALHFGQQAHAPCDDDRSVSKLDATGLPQTGGRLTNRSVKATSTRICYGIADSTSAIEFIAVPKVYVLPGNLGELSRLGLGRKRHEGVMDD